MNRKQKLTRAKKLRIRNEKHGSNATPGTIAARAQEQAQDKTPSSQRTGNYYEKVQHHVPGQNKGPGNTYTSIQPRFKKSPKKPTFLFNVMQVFKQLFNK